MIGTATSIGKKYKYSSDWGPSKYIETINKPQTIPIIERLRLLIASWYFKRINIKIAKQKHNTKKEDT
jgi:hypothetical protein